MIWYCVMVKTPKISWQDGFILFAFFFGVGVVRSEDFVFVSLHTLAAGAFAIFGIMSHGEYPRWARAIACVIVSAVLTSLDVSQYRAIRGKDLTASSGSIFSAEQPQPLSKCGMPLEAVALYAGKTVSWADKFPFSVFTVNGRQVLTLNKNSHGDLLISASVFDDRRNLIAKIQDNAYVAAPYAARFNRPDYNSFVVYDHKDDVALAVRFINNTAVQFLGTLRDPDSNRALVVGKDSIDMVSREISGKVSEGCVAGGFSF